VTSREADPVSWLPGPWPDALRTALRSVAPGLIDDGDAITLGSLAGKSDPRWSSAAAVVGERYVVKFAWSQLAATKLWREAQVVTALRSADPALPLPEVCCVSRHPMVMATTLVAGEPLTIEWVGRAEPEAVGQLGAQLAAFLVALHRPEVLLRIRESADSLETPEPQATTEALRSRFGAWIGPRHHSVVEAWCDWADEVLRVPTGRTAFLHGDLHGHNEIWDPEHLELRAVVDFETAGPGEPEFDLRYLPAQGPTVDLLTETMTHYEGLSGRALSLERVMAWHVRTVLGDALWRSEASAPLPGGGTPSQWVDALAQRFVALDLGPR
jgi:aminoglycoside phosphotransferase (APT) family kinase protein